MSRNISDKEWKLLIATSGGFCAFPRCVRQLAVPGTEYDNAAFLGQAAHIIADSRQGPRGRSELSDEDRDKHTNLILLCGDHHKLIDSQPHTYSVPVLHQMKRDHEERVRQLNRGTVIVPRVELKSEVLHSSLLPVTHLPEVVFAAPTDFHDNQTQEIRRRIVYPPDRNELTPFLLREGMLLAFHDLRDRGNPFAEVTDFGSVELLRSVDLWQDPEGRRRFVTLLNRSLYKYTILLKVRYDPEHRRFYFPVHDGTQQTVSYHSLTGRRSTRKVAWEPQRRSTGEGKGFWFHLGAGLRFHQLARTQWCLSIRPERHLTIDGVTPLPAKKIGPRVTSLKARMYNDPYLGEVNFWREYLAQGRPRIILRFGHQSAIIEAKLIDFAIQWPGILGDDKPYTHQVAQEDLFSLADWHEALEGEPIEWEELSEDDLEQEDAS